MKEVFPSFAEIAEFVREFGGIPQSRVIDADTRIDSDLGITGDDGGALLRDIAAHFDVILAPTNDGYRRSFGLAENEFLFHSEGVDLLGIGAIIRWISGESKPVVVDLTVGRLHEVVCRERTASHAI